MRNVALFYFKNSSNFKTHIIYRKNERGVRMNKLISINKNIQNIINELEKQQIQIDEIPDRRKRRYLFI